PADREAGGAVLTDPQFGPNQYVAPDADAANDLGARADEHVIADARAAGHLAEVDAAERHVVGQIAVVADRHLSVDEDPAIVAQIKAVADAHVARDVDTEAYGVAVQCEHQQVANAVAAPQVAAAVGVTTQQHCITKARCHQKARPEGAHPELANMAPQVRRDESSAAPPADRLDRYAIPIQ